MSKLTSIFICMAAMGLHSVYAATEQEIKDFQGYLLPVLASCLKEHSIPLDQILAIKDSRGLDNINPCFMACSLKKLNFITADGLYDNDTAVKFLLGYLHDEDEKAKYEEIGRTCISVNELTVSDPQAGCERSKALLTCILNNGAGDLL